MNKNTTLFLVLFILFLSCSKDDEINIENQDELIISLELKRPEIILNDLATGVFNNGMLTNVSYYFNNDLYTYWNYEANELGRIYKITRINPNYTCEQEIITFYYNETNLIKEVSSIRDNICQNFEAKWIYTYNYDDGLLVSIKGKSYFTNEIATEQEISISDNYFSYNVDGTIEKIFSNGRPITEPLLGFNERKLSYDNQNNVIEILTKEFSDDSYYQKFTIEYEEVKNPFKGFFINTNIQTSLPNVGFASTLGPNYISNNFIKKTTTEFLNINPNQTIENISTNTNNELISDYGSQSENNDFYRIYLNY